MREAPASAPRERQAKRRARRSGSEAVRPLLGDGEIRRRFSPLHWCGQRVLGLMRSPKTKARLRLDAADEALVARIILLEDHVGFAHDRCILHDGGGNPRVALWFYDRKVVLEGKLVLEYQKQTAIEDARMALDSSVEAEPLLQALESAAEVARQAMSGVDDALIRRVLREQSTMIRDSERMGRQMSGSSAVDKKILENRGILPAADGAGGVDDLSPEELAKLAQIRSWAGAGVGADGAGANAHPSTRTSTPALARMAADGTHIERAFPAPREVPPRAPMHTSPVGVVSPLIPARPRPQTE